MTITIAVVDVDVGTAIAGERNLRSHLSRVNPMSLASHASLAKNGRTAAFSRRFPESLWPNCPGALKLNKKIKMLRSGRSQKNSRLPARLLQNRAKAA